MGFFSFRKKGLKKKRTAYLQLYPQQLNNVQSKSLFGQQGKT